MQTKEKGRDNSRAERQSKTGNQSTTKYERISDCLLPYSDCLCLQPDNISYFLCIYSVAPSVISNEVRNPFLFA